MGTRWVALLRGIAPMHPNQKNVDLRGVCERLGFTEVVSVQSSGNLVFDSASSDRAEVIGLLEAAWPDQLGFEARTILRTPAELEALVALAPYGAVEHGPTAYQLVTFFPGPVDIPFTTPHRPAEVATEVVHATDRELFTLTDTTATANSPLVMGWVERTFGKDQTSRTFPTLSRILKKC